MPQTFTAEILSARELLLGILRRSGLAGQSGKVLYSGISTLRRGPLYVVGFNPGGDAEVETTSCADHLMGLPERWSEYTDAAWRPSGRWCLPGGAKMQRGVRAILDKVGLDCRDVCSSNLIFVRSRDKSALGPSRKELEAACWPAHEFLLNLIRPRAILAIDTDTFDSLRRRFWNSRNVECFDAMWGGLSCRIAPLQIGGTEVRLIGTPNLSRYTPYTPDRRLVIEALADRLRPCIE